MMSQAPACPYRKISSKFTSCMELLSEKYYINVVITYNIIIIHRAAKALSLPGNREIMSYRF